MENLDYDIFLRPEVVAGLLVIYLVSKPVLVFIRDAIGVNPKSEALKMFMVLHNLALCIFSGWVSINCWPILVNYALEHGWERLFVHTEVWNEYGVGKWCIVFFVSKFYEFVDSWLIVLKGRQLSFLQVYHHSGIVLTMYFACLAKANWLGGVVCLNSFIHTIMYFYYTFSTMGYKSPLAKMLTTLQLTQFFLGMFGSIPGFWFPIPTEQKYALLFMHVYTAGVIYLFMVMYQEKYNKKKKQK